MNTGAQRARGDIMLFLHADSELPTGYLDAIQSARRAASATKHCVPRWDCSSFTGHFWLC